MFKGVVKAFGFLKAIMKAGWRPLLIGIAIAFLGRAYVIDIYGVSKPSMEPTLHSRERGHTDRVAVLKTTWLFNPLKRWDLCVFRRKMASHNIVKRVVGLPGEWIRIEQGDVFIGKSPRHLRLLKKTPGELKRILVPIADTRLRGIEYPADTTWKYDPERFTIKGGSIESVPGKKDLSRIEWRGLVHGGFITPEGEINLSPLAVRDFGVELTWIPGEKGACLGIKLEALGRVFEARTLSGGGIITVTMDKNVLFSVRSGKLKNRKPLHLTFIQADCRVFLWVGQKPFFMDVPPWPGMDTRVNLKGKWNGITLEMEKRGTIKNLRVLRDLFYSTVQGAKHGTGAKPEPIGEDEFYVLGDNTAFSEDSRYYGPIKTSWIIGKAILIVLPINRVRWL